MTQLACPSAIEIRRALRVTQIAGSWALIGPRLEPPLGFCRHRPGGASDRLLTQPLDAPGCAALVAAASMPDIWPARRPPSDVNRGISMA